ncbi:MAG: protoheme IX farnesyltransferase [Dehalococcoidia bacterium]|nr:MAG: protoheme IX farnesyltransferase [Dehalococcoidia bacterium]
MPFTSTVKNYIEVLKPRETLLLGFIGLCSVIIGAQGHPPIGTLFLATLTILIASAGANGLTNYLDRDVDARMRRTCGRVLPTKRIQPPWKVLAWSLSLISLGLALAWVVHPYAFAADLAGTVAAAVFRKRVICVFPQGAIASCAPVLMGWFAVNPHFTLEAGLLCLLICAWLPLHVWSVMVSHRDDYIGAGITFFPMNVSVRTAVLVLLVFALVLNVAAVSLYYVAGFNLLYLLVAVILGAAMLFATARLVSSHTSKDAWKLYKLSSFPYLGLIFVAMCISIWVG